MLKLLFGFGTFMLTIFYFLWLCNYSLILCGVSKNHPDIAGSYNNLGNVHHNMGDYTRELEYYIVNH